MAKATKPSAPSSAALLEKFRKTAAKLKPERVLACRADARVAFANAKQGIEAVFGAPDDPERKAKIVAVEEALPKLSTKTRSRQEGPRGAERSGRSARPALDAGGGASLGSAGDGLLPVPGRHRPACAQAAIAGTWDEAGRRRARRDGCAGWGRRGRVS